MSIFEGEIERLQRERVVQAAASGTTLLHNYVKEPLLPPLVFLTLEILILPASNTA